MLDRVRFLGVRRDISRILAAADLFVFPTFYEGLPVALLEALASRRACVASRIEPIKEVIEDGVSGILVEPGNPQEIADAVIRLLSDPQRRLELGARGRELIESRFDIRKNIRLLECIYEKTLRSWGAASQTA